MLIRGFKQNQWPNQISNQQPLISPFMHLIPMSKARKNEVSYSEVLYNDSKHKR